MILPACTRIRRLIRRLVERDPIRYRSLREDLVAANMGVTLERYLLRTFLVSGLFGLFWAVLALLTLRFAVLPQVSIRIYNVFAIRLPAFMLVDPMVGVLQVVASAVVFIITAYAGSVFFLRYPSLVKKNRETRINLLLHHAVAYMYAMRQGGAEMMAVFRAISGNSGVYGEAAHEFRRVVRDTDYFGYDQITALRHLQETTPSEKLREFTQDLVSVVESGGDMLAFLDARVRTYQEEARFEQKAFLSTLQLVAEAYVTLFVAGPLFIIIVMVVMGFMGSTPILQLSVIIYLLVPVGSLFFILFLDAISIKTEGIERYTEARWLNEFDDVPVEERTGDEPLVRQLQYYDRVRNLRAFLRHPLRAFLVEPNRTFYVTVPIALAYVLLAFLATPAYTDVEVLIDVLDDHLVVALLVILVPFGIFHGSWQKTVMELEAAIPEFLNRLSGINQVGLTLAQAITIVVRADLGVLTYEIRKIKRDIEWGASVQDALVRFEERIRTPTIARAVTLITTASRMTGGIGDVLNIAARDAAMSETLKRERRAEMFIYVTIVYLVFIVFLFVVAVIDAQFLSVLAGVDALAPGSMPGGLSFGNTPIATFERLLYHACLIQAFFSGLIAGAMGEASLRAGVKHAAVMIIIAFVVFNVFL
ncbi:Archaeal flagella assembly protein J [Methanoculleus bourgensis MS2]|uniref:Archaeal flagella assembly protein J n=1 Tax=Methanoculleus bourgensis (strain ATCC 43281 / DSM 3045 / OCM 15 / MS2) TaxID=1201294 RepID=I7KXD4_METBM|nr:type II secretion system F family protein [Methanoculleus bourgensis]CCJ35085.1 Archaeal flagella assembly protein J [Methanoculleus bourgensis MS2]